MENFDKEILEFLEKIEKDFEDELKYLDKIEKRAKVNLSYLDGSCIKNSI